MLAVSLSSFQFLYFLKYITATSPSTMNSNEAIERNKKNRQYEQPTKMTPIIQIQSTTIQSSCGISDPENSTPPSNFMDTLKSRLYVYYPEPISS